MKWEVAKRHTPIIALGLDDLYSDIIVYWCKCSNNGLHFESHEICKLRYFLKYGYGFHKDVNVHVNVHGLTEPKQLNS